jgi:hypothetical protein
VRPPSSSWASGERGGQPARRDVAAEQHRHDRDRGGARHLLPIVALAVLVSLTPISVEALRSLRARDGAQR